MSSIASSIPVITGLPKSNQAEIINAWTHELSNPSIDQEEINKFKEYQKVNNIFLSFVKTSFFEKPEETELKKAVEKFEKTLNKAITTFIIRASSRSKLQQATSQIALDKISQQPTSPEKTSPAPSPSPTPSPSPQLSSSSLSSQASQAILPLPLSEQSGYVNVDPSLPSSNHSSPRMAYRFDDNQINQLLLDIEPRAPSEDPLKTHVSWFSQAFKEAIRQFPKEQRAALIAQIKDPSAKGRVDISKAIYTWCITQILRESFTSKNVVRRDLPEFLKSFEHKRPNGASLNLREMMIEFAKPEEIPSALTRQEKANIVLGSQLLSPILISGRASRHAQNILDLAALAEKENPSLPILEMLSDLDLSIPDEPSILETVFPSEIPDSPEESSNSEILIPHLRASPAKKQNELPPYLNEETTLMYERALAGNPVDEFNLGVAYELGQDGFPIDPEEAGMWYKIAAKSNLPGAKENLALFLETGKGRAGWTKLSNEDNEEAQLKLANFYETGQYGFPQCDSEAVKLYKRTEKKNVTSQKKLIELYNTRRGGLQESDVSEYLPKSNYWLKYPKAEPSRVVQAIQQLCSLQSQQNQMYLNKPSNQ